MFLISFDNLYIPGWIKYSLGLESNGLLVHSSTKVASQIGYKGNPIAIAVGIIGTRDVFFFTQQGTRDGFVNTNT